MEANIFINKNKYELKYIKVKPGKLISEELKPSFTKFQNGRHWWSKQTSFEVEARWVSDAMFDGIPERTVNANLDRYQVKDGKLYFRPCLEIVFDNSTIIERFDTDSALNDRLISLRANVFAQPEVNLSQFNTEGFELKAQWCGY